MSGNLLYLIASKFDVCFKSGVCARYQIKRTQRNHIYLLLKVIHFANGTINDGFWYSNSSHLGYGYIVRTGETPTLSSREHGGKKR